MAIFLTVPEDLPNGPLGLLHLADAFERAGQLNLAGSLRRWADELAVARGTYHRQGHLLLVVACYAKWLDTHGRGTSFSTFVNEFGYEEADCSKVYQLLVSPALDLLREVVG